MKFKFEKSMIIDIVEVIVSIFFILGINFWFHGCENTEMSCHKAETVLKAISYIMLFLTLVKVFMPNRSIKMGISIGVFALAFLMVLVPGTLIDLCMYETMHCHTSMKPWTLVFGIVFMTYSVLEVAYGFYSLRKVR